jgi:hypothetical protein
MEGNMSQFSPQNLIAVIAWLGGACFCGVLPLAFAAILFFTARKRGQVGSAIAQARSTKVAALNAGSGLVRVQGQITDVPEALDGPAETALAYLRLKIEIYEQDSDSSGWRGFQDKARAVPFHLDDGTGAVWVPPEKLDKQLLGDAVTPNDDQVQAACILLGIDPRLRGRLRFFLWELRRGQPLTVIGGVAQGVAGLEIGAVEGQPFVVSPLLGQVVDSKVSTQTNKARTWMLVLGIPGVIFLLCGLTGALIALIRLLFPG